MKTLKFLLAPRINLLRIIIGIFIFSSVQFAMQAQIDVPFSYTGSEQSWVVPANVYSIFIEAYGASGGDAVATLGGKGGYSDGHLQVTPGQVLYVNVGRSGLTVTNSNVPTGGGFNGGGDARGPAGVVRGAGGGASDVRLGGNTLNHRVLVAGGGGGACPDMPGGDGGGFTAGDGMGTPNSGGTQTTGGQSDPGIGCTDGLLGQGGSSGATYTCAGGGGGWYGGASGCAAGGGSGYIGGVTNAQNSTGGRIGSGFVKFTYTQSSGQPNDFCSTPIPISCGDVVMGNTENVGIDNPPACNTTNGTSGGLWYSFVGIGDDVTFSTCNAGSNFQTKLSVYLGICDELICVDGVEASPGCNGLSELTIPTVSGAFYYILVNGVGTSEGDFQLEVTCGCPLEASCPADLNLNCDDPVPPLATTFMEFMEQGGMATGGFCGPPIYSGYVFTGNEVIQGNTCDGIQIERMYMITWPLTGATISCSQIINIASGSPLTIQCPADLTVSCKEEIVANPNAVGYTADCDPNVGVYYEGPYLIAGNENCPGAEYHIIYTVAASCGRTIECTQTFFIANDGPTITCLPDVTVSCESEMSVGSGDVQVTTSCGLGYITPFGGATLISGTANCPGAQYGATFTVIDDCGRTASCTRIFTIQNDSPFINCPGDEIVTCTNEINVSINDVEISTSCGLGSTVSLAGPTLIAGTHNCPGAQYQVVYTLTDDCGRSATCSRIFTIQNTAPTISCPIGSVVECVSNIPLDPSLAIVTTSCTLNAIISVTGPTLISGQAECNGAMYEVQYTVTDACGRSASCFSTYTLSNDGPVVLQNAPDRIVECADEISPESENIEIDFSCGVELFISPSEPYIVAGAGNCEGATYEIMYLITDECGRSTTSAQRFQVVNEGPKVYAPEMLFISCLDELEALVFNNCYYESSCGIPVVKEEVVGPIYDANEPLCDGSIINFLYTVWDACGRSNTVASAIIFRLDENVLADEFPDTTVGCDDMPLDGNEVDVCGFEFVTFKDQSKELPNGNTEIQRLFEAIDSCANAYEYTQIITMECERPDGKGDENGKGDERAPRINPELSSDISITVFPNPTRDFIQVQSSENKAEQHIMIYNSVGQLIFQSDQHPTGSLNIDTRTWKSGIYHVVLMEANTVITTEKLVKQE